MFRPSMVRRPYSGFPLKLRDLTVALPKLYVMTIDESLGVFCRGLIVRAHKLDCSEEMPVTADNIRPFAASAHRHFTEHRRSFLSVRFPTRNAKFRRATELFCDLWG
jgi:hypothetical protein